MAKKSSKSKEKVKKNKKIKEAKAGSIDINKVRAAFYAKQLEGVEKDLQLVSNSVIEPERLSSGVLVVDYIFGGGFIGLVSIAGEEGTAKTSICYHTLAVAKAQLDLPFVGFYDAEGAISPRYTKNIWKPFGLDLDHLLSKKGREDGFYYYRDQVIERMFDYLKKALKMMPDKNWVSDANSWCYFFPKRDEYFKKLMEVMEMKPSKVLSGGAHYVVPTENSKPEGLFSVDSFASLLTREEEDKEDTGSTRSAMEAAAFAKHLKRVKVDSLEKKIVILGTNHLGSHVRTQYGGPDEQQYEKMGNSLKYFCLHPDEYVLTDQGMLSIQEVEDLNKQYPDNYPVVGTLKGQEQSSFFGFVGKKATIIAKTANGRMINGGIDHRVLAITKYQLKPTWTKLKDLTPEHYIPTKMGNNLFPSEYVALTYSSVKLRGRFQNSADPLKNVDLPKKLDERLAELLGVLVADGHVKSSGLIYITKVDEARKTAIKNLFKDSLGIILNTSKKGLTISSQNVAGFLAYLGLADKKTENKSIPLLIRKSPKSVQLAFLKGYLSCDSTTDDGKIKVHSSSKYIVRQMSIMLLNMGVYNVVDDNFYTHERKLNVNTGYVQGTMSTLIIPNKDVGYLLGMMGGLADYTKCFPENSYNRAELRSRWFNPSDVMPNIWGWNTKTVNEILGKVSKYARKKGIHLGKTTEGLMYWEELNDDILKAEYRDNSTGFNTVPRRNTIRELYRLKKFTKVNNLVWEKIDSLKVNSEQSLTYDFEVPGSHTVIAGGIVGHNSDQRARAYNRASSSASKYGKFDYDKDNSKFGIEKSVEGSGSDRYAYKEIKNVKNKFGNPGLKAPFRVWVSDHRGKPRGIDPVFDVYMFLKITGQLGTTKSGKKGKNLVFKLKPSFGKKRAEALNDSEPFSFLTLKTLVIGEYTNDNSLIRKAVSELGISIKPKLRETLFAQLKNDDLLYSSSKEVKEEDDEDVDYEEI